MSGIKGSPLNFARRPFPDALAKSGVQRDYRVVVKDEFHSPMTLVDYWDAIRKGGMDFWNMTEKMVLENVRKSGVQVLSKA
ncbi:hypothetical protein CPB84DRAFT_1843715 [Gymnopilus junonius]|uniref:Uncharacterized protein n=1 Tax=Gymnopilus junonius TaxID=109634 RepID=A0A9P5TR19_GYMJU|nr:hypothetical protein CPB84DRAFT_1843715 [Gymnopilus junonius]